MKKILLIMLSAVLLFSACQKKYITSLTLATTQTNINLPASGDTTDSMYCYIAVFSNTDWSCHLEREGDWCRLDREGGQLTQYVRMEYDKNYTGMSRTAQFIVVAGTDTCKIHITQP